jgi:serine protease Do
MKRLAVLALLFLPTLAEAALSRIELTQGGRIEARIIDERPDRIVADLGFTVLSIPRDAIASITAEDAAAEEVSAGGNLYRPSSNLPLMSVKELAQNVGDAVVTVTTPVGLGSGFIIHPSGYVVTNDHVVAGENKISITVFEREEGGEFVRTQFENVRIIASSPDWDLALLKIEDAGNRVFKTVAVGSDGDLRPGQRVFAIGNPLGLERSVSEGIVSIPSRLIGGHLLIQMTAQISPGNSGGPLFNMRGEVIGVNNLKVVGFGAEGLAFAVPSETLRDFIEHRDTFAFDPRNPNSGYRYNSPPSISSATEEKK